MGPIFPKRPMIVTVWLEKSLISSHATSHPCVCNRLWSGSVSHTHKTTLKITMCGASWKGYGFPWRKKGGETGLMGNEND